MMIGVMVSSGLVRGGTARRSKGVIWAVFHTHLPYRGGGVLPLRIENWGENIVNIALLVKLWQIVQNVTVETVSQFKVN